MRIDIVSDVVCPWCIIGYRQLEQALGARKLEAEIHWQPFELNPQMPEEGQNLREHLAAKYGSTVEASNASRARLTRLGAELGFTFAYTDDMRTYNTFRAHQLLHWAATEGRQHELQMALFAAFFTRCQNIADPAVLADVAAGAGLDRAEALAVLEDARFAEAVRQEERFWVDQGIQGVPAVIFERRHLVSGAQGVERFGAILDQLTAAATA